MTKGDKIVAMGFYTKLTRDTSIQQLTKYYGGFYGFQPYTGYPVFDDPKRVSIERTPWVFDLPTTHEDALKFKPS